MTYNGLGNFYLKTNDFQKAEDCYTKAIEINPKRSQPKIVLILESNKVIILMQKTISKLFKTFSEAPDRGIIEQATNYNAEAGFEPAAST